MEKTKLRKSAELNNYIKKTVKAAERGDRETVRQMVNHMTHKDFRDFKIVFDLTKYSVHSAILMRDMIETDIKKVTSTNFQNKVSFLMP